MTPADEHGPEPPGEEILAAEYVLGVLPVEERQQAAARIERDPAFARLVEIWEGRLAPMAEGYREVDPPPTVKAALDRRLFAGGRASSRAGAGLWRSLAFWRGIAVAALAAAAIAVALPLLAPPDEAPRERYVASLAHDDTDVHYFVVYDERTHDVGLSHVTGARPEDRDFELWVIEGDDPPESVGVIPDGANVNLAVADALQRKIAQGASFAISTEPQGGSPTGEPTGPVVALGELKAI